MLVIIFFRPVSRDKTGSDTYDTVYIKDTNNVAVSTADGENRCITIIDIESQEVMTTISMDTYIFGMAVEFPLCCTM
jgi:hypothetical protein